MSWFGKKVKQPDIRDWALPTAPRVQPLTECFWCVVKNRVEQRYEPSNQVVTQYKGTPLCGLHAKEWIDGGIGMFNGRFLTVEAIAQREATHA